MQQVEYLRQKLQINQFPQLKTSQFGIIRAPQLILFFLALSFIFNLLGIYTFTYLFLGFFIPLICRYKDIQLLNYWECLAMLLYLRTFVSSGQIFDGLVLLFLWHPEFKGAMKIVDYVKSFKEKGHVDSVVKEISKRL